LEFKELDKFLQHRKAVEQMWPQQKQLNLQEAFKELLPKQNRSFEDIYRFVQQFQAVPILAVAGLLNSGKSSLVSSFLSSENRSRVLRGVGSKDATNRFVLWTPASWCTDQAFKVQLESLLEQVFGSVPDPLPEEVNAAHEAYRNINRFEIPLIASDKNLDKLGIALLDCHPIPIHHCQHHLRRHNHIFERRVKQNYRIGVSHACSELRPERMVDARHWLSIFCSKLRRHVRYQIHFFGAMEDRQGAKKIIHLIESRFPRLFC